MELSQWAVNECQWASVSTYQVIHNMTIPKYCIYGSAKCRLDGVLVEVDGFRQHQNDRSTKAEPLVLLDG